jgi:hypothetical protein
VVAWLLVTQQSPRNCARSHDLSGFRVFTSSRTFLPPNFQGLTQLLTLHPNGGLRVHPNLIFIQLFLASRLSPCFGSKNSRSDCTGGVDPQFKTLCNRLPIECCFAGPKFPASSRARGCPSNPSRTFGQADSTLFLLRPRKKIQQIPVLLHPMSRSINVVAIPTAIPRTSSCQSSLYTILPPPTRDKLGRRVPQKQGKSYNLSHRILLTVGPDMH